MAFFIPPRLGFDDVSELRGREGTSLSATMRQSTAGVTWKALHLTVHRATRGNGSTQEPVRPQIVQHACEVEGFSRRLGMSAIADTEEALSVAPAIPHRKYEGETIEREA